MLDMRQIGNGLICSLPMHLYNKLEQSRTFKFRPIRDHHIHISYATYFKLILLELQGPENGTYDKSFLTFFKRCVTAVIFDIDIIHECTSARNRDGYIYKRNWGEKSVKDKNAETTQRVLTLKIIQGTLHTCTHTDYTNDNCFVGGVRRNILRLRTNGRKDIRHTSRIQYNNN